MDDQKKKDIALMRYGAIAPVVSDTLEDFPSKSAYFRDVSERGIKGIDGTIRHYSPDTIKSWYEDYKKDGFDGLIPATRCDRGVSRKIDEDISARIKELKDKFPRITSTAIYNQLIDDCLVGPHDLSASTVNRFVNQLDLKRECDDVMKDMRRYERPHINEVWCGDSCVGPYMTTLDGRKRRIYVIALIDDCSRFITGIGAFFNDNFVNLMTVMRSAVAKYGKPKIFRFDNGHSYKNQQMELLAARLGCTLSYCHPYSPQQKAKIERFFRTFREQCLATLDMSEIKTLEKMNGILSEYVLQYNKRVHSSLAGKSPQQRFFDEPELIRRLSEQELHDTFMLEVQRTVSIDCVIKLNDVEYEVDPIFSRKRITIRYTPDVKEVYVVQDDGVLRPITLLDKHANAVAKRNKVHLSEGD